MSITHFTTTDKHVRQLILISYVGTDVSAMGSLMWKETSAHRNFTYNYCPSRGLNLGHSDEKEVHCPLRYLDTSKFPSRRAVENLEMEAEFEYT